MSACDPITRRDLLLWSVAAAGASAVGGCAAQVETVEYVEVGLPLKELKALALYKDFPNRQDSCARCLRFVAPNACYAVYGPVSPAGWCRNFRPINPSPVA